MMKKRYTVIPRVLIFVFRNNKLLMMKYSGKGENQTREKTERKDIYNPIGGHIEKDEDIIQTAIKEAREEAGVTLFHPKIKGVININNFAGENLMMFVISSTTYDEPLSSTIEGELEWVEIEKTRNLSTFPDFKQILDTLLALKENNMFVGTAQYDGKFGLLHIDLRIIK